jgi:2',3'-cyclic-nucleotide 2'-phosphodiesterase (5'-nucleotidase family)
MKIIQSNFFLFTKKINIFFVLSIVIFSVFGRLLHLVSLDNGDIVIYHTNDMHGHVNSEWSNGILRKIGLDVVKGAKQSVANSCLIDAGDFIKGTAIGKYNSEAVIKLMNAAGYDAVTLGNHEFDSGISELKKCVKEANFSVLASNIKENGKPFLDGISKYNTEIFIKEIAGRKIGFFGITTGETKDIVPPPTLEGLNIRNEIETARRMVSKLKDKNVDAIVAITHMGNGASSKFTSYDIAKQVSGVNAIIDGHSHDCAIKQVNGVVISQVGAYSNNLGKLEISFKGKSPKVRASIINSAEAGVLFKPDQEIQKLYQDFYSEISNITEKIIGKSENIVFGGSYEGKHISRMTETPCGNLLCDSMIWYFEDLLKKDKNLQKLLGEDVNLPIVAFENGGTTRKSLKKGYIKMLDIIDILPFENRLTVQVITPKKLFAVLERGVGKLRLPKNEFECFGGYFGGFPQISGINMIFNVSNNPYNFLTNTGGSRVSDVNITDKDGKEIKKLDRSDDTTKILFLFNDFAIYEFPSVCNEKITYIGNFIVEIFKDYIRKITLDGAGSFNYPFSKGRIIMNGCESFPYFEGEITIKDSSGFLSSTEVYVKIDNDSEKKYKSDENGKIIIKNIPTGIHRVSIKFNDLISDIILSNIADLRSGVAFFSENKEDFENVSNIIGQIPYNLEINDENLLIFARKSYELLSDEEKSKVLNYSKLEKAENIISQLKGEFSHVMIPVKNNKRILIASISSVILITFLFIFYKKYSKYV